MFLSFDIGIPIYLEFSISPDLWFLSTTTISGWLANIWFIQDIDLLLFMIF